MIYVNNDSEQYQNVYIPRTTIVTGHINEPFDPTDYWTSGQTENYVEDVLTAYTPTSGFTTINGSAITEGGNIEVSPSYSAGTNIDITDDVISVTGITIPTSNTAFTNDAGYITQDALSGYAESSAVTLEINQAVSGLAEQSAVTQQISAATSGLAESSAVTQEIQQAVSGLAESSAVTQEISAATSGLAETTAVTQEISTALSSYTPTSGFSTINGSAITSGGNITISGGSGAAAIEMTQAQYDALSGNVSADTFYIITDATPIDMSNYATTGDIATINTTLSGKADAQNITANTNAYKFPKWNSQGVVNGEQGTAYYKNFNINGSNWPLASFTNNNWTAVFAPTSAGTAGDVCVSQGSGAPKWATLLSMLGVDFWIGSQDDYDNMASHSNTRLYIIDPDL